MADLSLAARPSASRARVRRSRSTFIVEAMLLLVCLLIVLAASMSLFAFAWQEGARAADEQRATTLAQSVAERFAADPSSIEPTEEVDGLQVITQTEWLPQAAGQMAYATITVMRGEDAVFELSTARYVPGEMLDEALGDAEEVRS